MMVVKQTVFCLIALVPVPSFAQTEKDSVQHESHYFYKELNYLDNLYSRTMNPVSLSHNKVRSIADATVKGRFLSGDFHAMDQGRKLRDLEATISGLQHFGKLDISGFLTYTNRKEFDRQWNSTLFVTPTNPYILCDDIASNVNTEIFEMSAAASYQFSDPFNGGLSLSYKTGSLSDQADPRPKTNAMRVVINPGVEFRLNDTHRLGLAASVDIFRSDMSYTVVNNNINYTYYVMKGMGDCVIRTSTDLAGYPRDYEGTCYKGALQWMMAPLSGNLRNLLEVSFATNSENSTDGGYAFTYKSGDYHQQSLTVYDRFNIRNNNRFHQNLSVLFSYAKDKGDWYDQKKKVDAAHGNVVYYEVLNKSKIMDNQHLSAQFSYQADLLKKGLPDITLNADVTFRRLQAKQYSTDVFKQNYNLLDFHLGSTKHWRVGNFRLGGTLGGFYSAQMGDPAYATANPDLADSYVAPGFEYASSSRMGFHAEAQAYLPVKLYDYATWMGLKVRVTSAFYQGDSKYSTLFDSTSRTLIDAAFNLKF